MGHLISEPKFKIPTSPPPLPANFWQVPEEEHEIFNKFVKKKDKYDKNILKAVFCLLELFTFSLSRAHAYHAMHNSVTGFHYLPFSSKIFENMVHLSFSMKLAFSARKCD